MKMEQEEQKIKELFLKVREEDKKSTPPFIKLLEGAHSRLKQEENKWPRFWMTTAAGSSFLLMIYLVVFSPIVTTVIGGNVPSVSPVSQTQLTRPVLEESWQEVSNNFFGQIHLVPLEKSSNLKWK
ncbi:MAG: hypothetical protein HYR79_09055 [Nitrospirae bacterium]|nr:hypothetical protein [Nitrospirota bacterium]